MTNFVYGSERLYPNDRYGISIDQSGIYQTPEKDYEFMEIPGMNGDLLFDNNRFRNITVPVNCFIRNNFPMRFRDLMNYLLSVDGYQKLYLPQDDNHYRMAVFRNATESSTGSFNKSGKFTLEFECKPERYLTDGAEWHVYASGSRIPNITRFNAKPIIRFYGNGTVTIGNKSVTVSGRNANYFIDIDCELLLCYNGSANMGQYVTVPNGYPMIAPNGSVITYTTDSTVADPCRVMPRWWEV